MDAMESSCALVHLCAATRTRTACRRETRRGERAGGQRQSERERCATASGDKGRGFKGNEGREGGQVTPPRATVAAGEITAPSLLARDVHKLCITLSDAHTRKKFLHRCPWTDRKSVAATRSVAIGPSLSQLSNLPFSVEKRESSSRCRVKTGLYPTDEGSRTPNLPFDKGSLQEN